MTTQSGVPQGLGERAATAGPLARRLAAKSEPPRREPEWMRRRREVGLPAKDLTLS